MYRTDEDGEVSVIINKKGDIKKVTLYATLYKISKLVNNKNEGL